METTTVEAPPSRRRGRWFLPAIFVASFAAAAVAAGIVIVGPVQAGISAAPLTVEPGPAATSPVTPQPAVTAPQPSPATAASEIFTAPTITIVPPPPPPVIKKGVRRTPSSSGGGPGPYNGLSSAQYCALFHTSSPLVAYSTSGSSPTAFRVAANQERAETGAGALSWSSGLQGTAQDWANQMASFENANPGLTPGSAEWKAAVFFHSSEAGHSYGENIAWNMGYANAVNEAESGWMHSTGHCLNIMDTDYRTIGAAAAQANDGSWFFVEQFYW